MNFSIRSARPFLCKKGLVSFIRLQDDPAL
jgi:hypothetical protein